MSNDETIRQQKIRAAYDAVMQRIPPEQREQYQRNADQVYEAMNALMQAVHFLDNAIEQVSLAEFKEPQEKAQILRRLDNAVQALLGGVMEDRKLSRVSILKIVQSFRESGDVERWITAKERR